MISPLRLKDFTSSSYERSATPARSRQRHNLLLIIEDELVRFEHYMRIALYQLRILRRAPTADGHGTTPKSKNKLLTK